MAQKETKIIGWGSIKCYSDRLGYIVCCETSVYFDFDYIGQGYGKQLQEKLSDQVRKFRYHHIVAKILGCNHSSIKFHPKFSFEIVGTQKEVGFSQGK